MTNREMAKGLRPGDSPKPNTTPLPPMPAAEGSTTPSTREEPLDSPQPNESGQRAAPGPGAGGAVDAQGVRQPAGDGSAAG